MRPGKYNFICPQGTTFSKQISYLIDSVPVNLTGYTARMQVREKVSSPCTVLDLTTENDGIEINECAGLISINVSATQTSEIYAKNYVYDLELESSDGFVIRLIEGSFNVTPEVTR